MSAQWRKANVLAVDDQRPNLVALDAVLSGEYNLVTASSGPEALEILAKRGDIDVILMDAQMPVMDGFETARRIKAMEGCADIPIVFITAVYNEDPFVKQGYKCGAVDYFSKPFDPEILKLKVGIYASFRQKADVLKERARQIRESEELMRASRRLSAFLEELRAAVIVTDREGRITLTNMAAGDLCRGLDPSRPAAGETILGWWSCEGVPLNGAPPFVRALAEGASSHEACIEIQAPDGTSRALLCVASALRDLQGAFSGAVVVVHDATERRQMERDLELRIKRMLSADTELHPG